MREEELEAMRRMTIIRAKLQCKHSTTTRLIQADLCELCKGVTKSGMTVDEVMDELEQSGFLKKIRSAQKIGRIVGKSAFWAGKALIAGGVSYVIFLVGKEIFAYTERKKAKKEKK